MTKSMTDRDLFYCGLCVKVARSAEEKFLADKRLDKGRASNALTRIGESWVVAVVKMLEAAA